MKDREYYELLKSGLQDLQDYLNGDLSKGREITFVTSDLCDNNENEINAENLEDMREG